MKSSNLVYLTLGLPHPRRLTMKKIMDNIRRILSKIRAASDDTKYLITEGKSVTKENKIRIIENQTKIEAYNSAIIRFLDKFETIPDISPKKGIKSNKIITTDAETQTNEKAPISAIKQRNLMLKRQRVKKRLRVTTQGIKDTAAMLKKIK